MIEGSVDLVTNTNASGWLYDRETGRTEDVLAFLHGRAIGEAKANIYRSDLEKVGFGDGRCGFNLSFLEPLQDSDLPFVTARPRGSNLTIPRTVEDTYIDLVAAVVDRHPGAGRNRSVLGGLWTDRTDALQILVGRINGGSCPGSIKEPLRRLIADGYVAISAKTIGPVSDTELSILTAGSAMGTGELQSAADGLAPALVTEELANLLRAVFDDVPVVYAIKRLTQHSGLMAQASAFEPFTSPAEVLAVYLPLSEGSGNRLDLVRDSHEFPEFTGTGRSRWTNQGADELQLIVSGREQPLDSVALSPGRMVLVGPGLIHRVISTVEDPVLRVLFAPKRNNPIWFLGGSRPWQEVMLSEGLRLRAM